MMAFKRQEKLLKERLELTITMKTTIQILRKIKARSLFILQTKYDVWLYKFEGPDYIELVENGQKSQYAKVFEEFIDSERMRTKLQEDRKRASQMIQEKLREPLDSNLALQFLFRNQQDIEEMVTGRNTITPHLS
jgi:hypothetical protein